ncbi:MAG: recombinase family protein, partial [Paracoccaceae bacterium]
PLRFHPRMADTYRDRVQALITGLGKSRELQTVQGALRALVERIVLHPSDESGSLDIVLEGALSGLLTLG